MKSVARVVVVLAAVVQLACLRHLHQSTRVPPAQLRVESQAGEAEAHRRNEEWFNMRHPDGGLRQKAVEEKQEMAADTSGTSGPWRAIGPVPIQTDSTTYSGVVWAIAVDPRNSSVVYVGTEGGVWKTTNGGTNWTPLTDQQANLRIRDLTLAPSAPDTIIAATFGGGILKSTDGGATWTTSLPGLSVLSVAVHPTNPSIVLAAAGPLLNPWRSTDGGSTWTKTNGNVFTQVVFDPVNGGIAYGAVNQRGVYRSTDSGVTWNPVAGAGLPPGAYGYTVAVAPSSTAILYLTVKGSNQQLIGFYRSSDSGATWTQIGVPEGDVTYWPWSLRVHPTNPNLIYAGCLVLSMSTDGGKTWTRNDNTLHVDHHAQAYSADSNTLYVGSDGGIWKNTNPTVANTSWTSLNATLNTALFYPGISISQSTPNLSLGGTQDNDTLQYQGNPTWRFLGLCGDGGYTAIDFEQPKNLYVACKAGAGVAASTDGGTSFHYAQTGIDPRDPAILIPPFIMDPSNPRRLYFGTNRVYQTLDGAGAWSPILSALANSGDAIVTIAVAPSDPNTVYAGRTSSVVYLTRNALSGTSAIWSAGTPVNGYITQIAVDPQNPLIAWTATVDVDHGGHVYRTADGGVTWTSLSSGLPKIPVNDIVLDPDISNTIYAATDIGVYRSVDGGQSWLPLGTGLPNVICHAIRLHRPSRTLRVATWGRGMWDLSVPAPSQVALTLSHAGNFTQGQPAAM